jgi:hypothetical protein
LHSLLLLCCHLQAGVAVWHTCEKDQFVCSHCYISIAEKALSAARELAKGAADADAAAASFAAGSSGLGQLQGGEPLHKLIQSNWHGLLLLTHDGVLSMDLVAGLQLQHINSPVHDMRKALRAIPAGMEWLGAAMDMLDLLTTSAIGPGGLALLCAHACEVVTLELHFLASRCFSFSLFPFASSHSNQHRSSSAGSGIFIRRLTTHTMLSCCHRAASLRNHAGERAEGVHC